MAEVGRHAHFGDADEMAGERLVMNVAAHQHFTQGMADLLADAKQADRAAFGGFDLAHQKRPCALSPRITRLVKVARAMRSPASSNSSASVSAMVLPRLITRPLPTNFPGRAAFTKLMLKSIVGA